MHSAVHIHHTIHHNFTTKAPRAAHPISQNPPQKHQKTRENQPHTTLKFFPNKSIAEPQKSGPQPALQSQSQSPAALAHASVYSSAAESCGSPDPKESVPQAPPAAASCAPGRRTPPATSAPDETPPEPASSPYPHQNPRSHCADTPAPRAPPLRSCVANSPPPPCNRTASSKKHPPPGSAYAPAPSPARLRSHPQTPAQCATRRPPLRSHTRSCETHHAPSASTTPPREGCTAHFVTDTGSNPPRSSSSNRVSRKTSPGQGPAPLSRHRS